MPNRGFEEIESWDFKTQMELCAQEMIKWLPCWSLTTKSIYIGKLD